MPKEHRTISVECVTRLRVPAARSRSMAKALCFRGVLTMIAGLLLAAASFSTARADEAEAHYRVGLNHKKKGETALAIEEIKTAVRLRPDHAAAHMTLGGLYAD